MGLRIALFAIATAFALTPFRTAQAAPQILAALEAQEGMPFGQREILPGIPSQRPDAGPEHRLLEPQAGKLT